MFVLLDKVESNLGSEVELDSCRLLRKTMKCTMILLLKQVIHLLVCQQ